MEIREYLDEAGRSVFARWFKGLDARAAAKVTTVLARLEAGNLSEVKSVGAGVFERRIHFGPGYRVYFGREGDRLIVLPGGGTKQGQHRDIEQAKRYWMAYRQRRIGGTTNGTNT
ncbi:type II toxin-antitoxin system RelE/ParE family toxin [Thiohalophilus sp.]|uniref:type II toxin-antitoxin system RelE/ParE family toxin n=1 Tax=Thiohalophilus sp. TaxID=3028392 RepID=UPI002ACDF41F|nr:type II toxin-antitoxin system RelE/ParE family toxin [Thiohalophilus sp.]MDZ7662825.1 type II toxin-antitoxin system RelE/ParE family toxin [Thiohalophilus sp.]